MSDDIPIALELPRQRQVTLWSDAWRRLRRRPMFLVPALVVMILAVMAAWPSLFTAQDPRLCRLANSLEPPTAGHPFGFDLQGCDYYARTVYGARTALVVGVTVATLTTLVALVLGSVAGYYRGWADAVVGRVTDVWLAIPPGLGAIALLSVVDQPNVLQITTVIVLFGWPTMARLMRSGVLAAVETEYVAAAHALGAGDARIMVRHILPNAVAPVIVYATILVGVAISIEAVISFLGVGLQAPAISWGLMINQAQPRILQAPHLLLFPGLFISATILSFVLLGDALRDALDPRLR